MTIYRFKVSFEDYDVSREVDIRSVQTFEDLHKAIHESLNYSPEVPSSFYISNDHWIKGTEITIYPNEKRKEKGIALMSNSRLNNFIEDPHQKFYYTSNFDRPFDLHVELIRISTQAESTEMLPKIIKPTGEPPKQFVQIVKPIEKSSSSTRAKKPLAEIIPEEEILPVADEIEEEEEEEPENIFSIEHIEDLDEGDHKGLHHKIADEETGDLDDIPSDPEDEDEYGDFGMDDHEEGNPHKDDY